MKITKQTYKIMACDVFETDTGCSIMTDREEPLKLLHLSISHTERYPTWDEIKQIRYEIAPKDITMAMLLPPETNYVNVHSNCFHLFQLLPEEQAVCVVKS
jgi:hypothetical protein